MSKVISFSDLKLIPELSHLNEIQMLHPTNDELMLTYLDKIGMDCEYAVEYLPSKHRNMQNNVVLGFQAVGELQCGLAFVNSVFCSTVERIAIASYQDRSLTQELAGMMNNTLDFNSFNDDGIEEEGGMLDQLEEDWSQVDAQIRQLIEIRDFLRGPPFNAAGSPKTMGEVKEWLSQQENSL